MRTTFFAIVLCCLTAPAIADELGSPTPAPAAAPASRIFGADAAAVVPVGDYARVADLAIGALARIEVPARQGFVTGRTGLLFHATNSMYEDSLLMVPLYAGYRYPVGTGGGYIAGELGFTYIEASVDTSFGRASSSTTKLGMTLTGGVRRGALDLRAGIFAPDIANAVGLIASAGYDFAAF